MEKMTIANKIAALRKQQQITQSELADRLFISHQAISQWENGVTFPDVTIIPELAKALNVSIGEIFSEEKPVTYSEEKATSSNLFNDDDYHIVLIYKNKVVDVAKHEFNKVEILLTGDLKSIKSDFSVSIDGNVLGDVAAGGSVTCDSIEGNATAGGSLSCDSVDGDVAAGGSVTCDSVDGDVAAGGSVTCDSVDGDVSAGGSITCDSIDGNVSAGGNIQCDTISGDVSVEGDITCEEIHGNINACGGTINIRR